jgi:hypothetical protein
MTPLLPRVFDPSRATALVCPLPGFVLRAALHRSKSSPLSRTWPPSPYRTPSSSTLSVFPHAVQCMTDTFENAALSPPDVLLGFVQHTF